MCQLGEGGSDQSVSWHFEKVYVKSRGVNLTKKGKMREKKHYLSQEKGNSWRYYDILMVFFSQKKKKMNRTLSLKHFISKDGMKTYDSKNVFDKGFQGDWLIEKQIWEGGGWFFYGSENLSRYADCQLGGLGSENFVSMVSARGCPKWAILASADIWITPNETYKFNLTAVCTFLGHNYLL